MFYGCAHRHRPTPVTVEFYESSRLYKISDYHNMLPKSALLGNQAQLPVPSMPIQLTWDHMDLNLEGTSKELTIKSLKKVILHLFPEETHPYLLLDI